MFLRLCHCIDVFMAEIIYKGVQLWITFQICILQLHIIHVKNWLWWVFAHSDRQIPQVRTWCIVLLIVLVQFSSVAQSCPTLCDPMNRSTPALPVHHQLPEFTQTHVHWTSDAMQPSHPLLSPSPPAPNPSQHQGLFQWVNSSHEVAKVLEFQLQHQSFQWMLIV